ncbi:MAG: hypothetical protein AABY22_14715, partial [Nanoarchaeota archaeon]
DTNNNSFIDKIEWITPHLSNQTFEIIIEISKAEHLNPNKEFISDIYEQVKSLDGFWSEAIPDQHFVRVTFEKNLTSSRDITIFPRIISGTPIIKIYEKDQNIEIAQFTNIQNNQYNKVFLTNLISQSQDIFDLQVLNGEIEFNHIIDPLIQNFYDNFEAGNLNKWNNVASWTTATDQKIETTSAKCVGANDCEMYLATNLDTSNASNINLNFSFRDDDLDGGGDATFYFNDSGGNWDSIGEIDSGTEDAWLNFSNLTTDPQYFHKGFNVRFITTLDGGGGAENLWIDNINISYTPDTTFPLISMVFPANNSNSSNVNLKVNFTVSDSALQACWWTNTSGRTNQTLTNCGTNISGFTWIEGINNITVYSNDTSNNVNSTSVKFTLDTISPNVNITFPLNDSNPASTSVEVNYTVNDNNGVGLNTCWWTNSSGMFNETITCGNNISQRTWFEGINNITIYVNDTVGNINSSSVKFTTPVSNTAPLIYNIFNNTLTGVSITENSFSNIIVNFSVFDEQGASSLDRGIANITQAGELTRLNSSCTQINAAGNYANYSCTIQVWYFDNAGAWTIRVGVNDSSNSQAVNYTSNFTLGQTTAFTVFPGNITFPSISSSRTNITSDNDPIIINNTGNKEINSTGIDINATNLVGESDSAYAFYAANFSISNNTGSSIECNGTTLRMANFTSVSNVSRNITANLSRGNHTLNDGVTAYENLYMCLNIAGNELSSQAYSTLSQGTWTIKIL